MNSERPDVSDFVLDFLGEGEDLSRLEDASIVILPVPFEKTTSWLQGTREGPRGILEASHYVEYYDMETGIEVYKEGIYTDRPVKEATTAEMIDEVYTRVRSFLEKEKFVVTLGGEHTVSLGSVKAYLKRLSPLTILSFDAHADMRDEYQDDRFNHACVMARVRELTDDMAMVGVRSMDSSELKRTKSVRMLTASEFLASVESGGEFIDGLSSNVYLSFDVDVLDPSIMPSTGTPEPGGLDWHGTLAFLKELFRKKNVVGFDVVEFCPNPHNKAPDFLVAKLINTLLSYKFLYRTKA